MSIFKDFIANIVTNCQGTPDFRNLVSQLHAMGGFRPAVMAGFDKDQYRVFRNDLEQNGVDIDFYIDYQEVVPGVTLEVGRHTLRHNNSVLGFMAYVADFKMLFTVMLRNPAPGCVCFSEQFYEALPSSVNAPKFALWLSQQASFTRGSANSIEQLAIQGRDSFSHLNSKLKLLESGSVEFSNIREIHHHVSQFFDSPVLFIHIAERSKNTLTIEKNHVSGKLEFQQVFSLILDEKSMDFVGTFNWYRETGGDAKLAIFAAKCEGPSLTPPKDHVQLEVQLSDGEKISGYITVAE